MATLLGIVFLVVLFFLFMAVSRERRTPCTGCGVRRSLRLGCGRCTDEK
jgi:hypothetical protein